MTTFSWGNAQQYSPLVLAYIGDGVHSAYVRARLAAGSTKNAHQLHMCAARFVRAEAQCAAVHKIMDKLTDKELSVYKRGRNAKSATAPKHADMAEYRHATGFEALIGYLYIDGQAQRLDYILDEAFKASEEIGG